MTTTPTPPSRDFSALKGLQISAVESVDGKLVSVTLEGGAVLEVASTRVAPRELVICLIAEVCVTTDLDIDQLEDVLRRHLTGDIDALADQAADIVADECGSASPSGNVYQRSYVYGRARLG